MAYYDYIVIGSGIAGLYSALLAVVEGSVLIITKSGIEDCNTRYAQGGIAAAIGQNDSAALHFKDTMAAGDGLCNEEAVTILAKEAPDRIADLIRFGVPFDTIDGEVALTREAAHSVPRILHAGGDATGEHIELTLSQQVQLSPIKVLEYCFATDILLDRDKVVGVRAIDFRSGLTEEYKCKYVILATGGAGRLFKYTTNGDTATGDGVALAYNTGAYISDMEFFQFHPTALRLPGVSPFLISEAVRGEGGILRNSEGRHFMIDYAPEADLAPRDVVARSILSEMKKTGCDKVFLDVTHLPATKVTTRFPHIYRFCLNHDIDITHDLIPVAPAAHYMMGGVTVNTWGETNIQGLFASGETACTGVHGANRLASNSLLEVLIFCKRIIERTQLGPSIDEEDGNKPVVSISHLPEREPARDYAPLNLSNLQNMLWNNVGIVRSYESLVRSASTLAAWQGILPEPVDRLSYELNSLVVTARLMTEAALLREESRGAHYRKDFPTASLNWKKHIIFQL